MDKRLGGLAFGEDAKAAVRLAAAQSATPAPEEKKRPRTFRRVVLTAVAACLAVVFSLSVAAAMFPDFEHLIRRLGEDLRQNLRPVEVHDEAQGIRMDVLAAVNDGDTAVIYVALTDEDGQRVDEATELHFVSSADSHCWGPLVDFDPETGTAIYRVEMNSFLEEFGKEAELEVNCVLTGVEHPSNVDTGLTLADILAANPEPQLAPDGGGVGDGAWGVGYGALGDPDLADEISAQVEAGTLPLLARHSAPIKADGVGWVDITAAGVVDGLLHLQYAPTGAGTVYSRTNFYLSWGDVDGTDPESTLTYAELDLESYPGACHDGSFAQLRELLLELPKDVPPEEVRLMAYGMTYGEHIEGEWAARFTLDDDPKVLTGSATVGDAEFSAITVSAIGIKGDYRFAEGSASAAAEGRGEAAELALFDHLPEFELYLKDGTRVNTDSAYGGADDQGNRTAGVNFARPISVDEVDRLLVDGQQVMVLPRLSRDDACPRTLVNLRN